MKGFKSGFEKDVEAYLSKKGVEFGYELFRLPYIQPAKNRTYTPDFFLGNGIIVETKGRFMSPDRQKHLWVRDQIPELDIRFLFYRQNAKLEHSKTTCAMWCEKNGFKYAEKIIPDEWIQEPPNEESLKYLRENYQWP